jgi:hypothetical protein
MQKTPRPLTGEQVDLLRGIVAERAPSLAGTAESIIDGKVLSAAQIGELDNVLMDALWAEDSVEGFTKRGKDIDNLIGIVLQWSEDFFR